LHWTWPTSCRPPAGRGPRSFPQNPAPAAVLHRRQWLRWREGRRSAACFY